MTPTPLLELGIAVAANSTERYVLRAVKGISLVVALPNRGWEDNKAYSHQGRSPNSVPAVAM